MIMCLILSTVPVIATGTLSYWQSSQAIQNYASQEKLQNVYQIQTNVEQVLKNIDHSITYFVRTSQLQEYIREPISGEAFLDYQTIKRDLNHLQSLDTGIEDIVLVSAEQNWLMNNNGLVRLELEQTKRMADYYFSFPGTSMWLLEEYDHIQVQHSVRRTSQYYINLVKKLPLLSTNKTGLISVLIPSHSLTDSMGHSLESESFLVLDENQQIISHSNPEYIGNDFIIPEQINERLTQKTGEGQFDYTIDDIPYKVTFLNSDYNNWTYLSLVRISDLNSRSNAIGWVTLIICVVLLLLSFIASILGSKNLYRPIRRIQDVLVQALDSSTAGKVPLSNEFTLIEGHINNLLNENKHLESRMQNQINQLKQLFIIRLLQGKVTVSELDNKLNTFAYNREWSQLTLLSLQIDNTQECPFNKNDTDLLLFAINNVIEDLIHTEARFTPVVINHTQSTILLSNFTGAESYTRFINEQISFIQTEIKRIFCLSVSIGISQPFTNLLAAKEAYNESLEALKYRIKVGSESIIFYNNLNRDTKLLMDYPKKIKYKLFDAIKLANQAKADQELDKLFEHIIKEDHHHTYYQIILSRFLYDLIELKQLLGVELDHENNQAYLNAFFDLKTLPLIKKWFRDQLIKPMIERVEVRTKSEDKTLSEKIIQIIQDDYDQDITLDIIASKLHYNPNYLSNIFQKETNRSFSEYLLLYRVNKAKEWLADTNLSVKEIAGKLKYNNSQNFIRSFRKVEGITPGNYRSQYR